MKGIRVCGHGIENEWLVRMGETVRIPTEEGRVVLRYNGASESGIHYVTASVETVRKGLTRFEGPPLPSFRGRA